MYFRIVIPNYNNSPWLHPCLRSVVNQSFRDFECIVVDDMSTDDSMKVIESYPVTALRVEKKSYNGGTRNVGLRYPADSKYTLFLDSDDWFCGNYVLQMIHDRLEDNHPDCLTLPYKYMIGKSISFQPLKRNTRKDLVDSVFVACWTKCIKSDLIVPFPENTLSEDVIQHIMQADVLNTFDSIEKPVVVWNRNNLNSCTRAENQSFKSGKWQASMYRYTADLIDMELKTPECEAQRKWRLERILEEHKAGKFI